MGLFDFIKDAGENLFKKKGSEAAEISELLNNRFEGRLSDLKVDFNNGAVALAGKCDSFSTKEKAVLLAGNVKGVEKVNDEKLTYTPESVSQFYTIVKGDTLSKIAAKYYGKGSKYPVIFEANREVIKDPNLIYPGQVIRIPKIEG